MKNIATGKRTRTMNSNSNKNDNANVNTSNNANVNTNTNNNDPPIWEARGVEWPFLSSSMHLQLPSAKFKKLYKSSKVAGNALGITSSSTSYHQYQHHGTGNGVGKSSAIIGAGGMSSDYSKGGDRMSHLEKDGNVGGTGTGTGADTGTADTGTTTTGASSSNSTFGGFMGKLIGGEKQNWIGHDDDDEFLDDDHSSYSIRPPNTHCVASANGWIMTGFESSSITVHSNGAHASSSLTSSTPSKYKSATMRTQQKHKNNIFEIPPLRLISRWNVRGGSSTSSSNNNTGSNVSSTDNHYKDGRLIPLPPPVMPTYHHPKSSKATSSAVASTSKTPTKMSSHSTPLLNTSTIGRIMHVFVDPTGCHTIISTQNGEAYYIHTLSKHNTVVKLKGFGPNVDGSSSTVLGCAVNDLPMINSSSIGSVSNSARKRSGVNDVQPDIQMGITAGSYITSIGWDKKRGNEGSTKKILIGTNYGEIYEYSLNATMASIDGTSGGGGSSTSSKVVSKSDDGRFKDSLAALMGGDDELPVLLVRLDLGQKTYGRISQNSEIMTRGGAVTGLHFERLHGSYSQPNSIEQDDQVDIIVLAVTSGPKKQTRLHTYLSTPSSENNESSDIHASTTMFHRAFSPDQAISRQSFVELPGSINHAELNICEEGFAMRTETGIYYGKIDKSNSIVVPFSTGSNGIVDAGILPYETSGIPVSIAITPYHFITLSETSELRFINRVAKKIIQKERVDWVSINQSTGIIDDGLHGGYGELIMDIRRPNQVWLWKSRSLVHISSSREDRDVWKFSLESCLNNTRSSMPSRNRGPHINDDKNNDAEFDIAKALCTNNVQKAVVTASRAKYHLFHDRIELAAKYMAMCPPELMPFAETSIQLALPDLGIGATQTKTGNSGLISYLLHKMQYYKTRNDNVACTMLGSWLVELYLHEREKNASQDQMIEESNFSSSTSVVDGNNALLQQFLASNAYNMDAETILRILCSHDTTASDCAMYAATSGDIRTAVNAALCIEDTKRGALDALRVLSDSPIEQAESYYYKHAFTLLCRAPLAASKSFLARYSDGLSATKLLPSFMRYEKKRGEVKKSSENKKNPTVLKQRILFVDNNMSSITYFEGSITLGCRSAAVYNYLVSLYVDVGDEIPLFDFITKHISTTAKTPGSPPKQSTPLDMNYALSTILQSGRHFRSAIRLYMGFGMRFRAVELAIKVDPSVAKELASESIDRDEKKRIWSMIARNAAMEGESLGGKEVVSKVLAVLNECGPGVLSIEDVLPFLPDVAQIDQFKEEICAALTSYSSKIDDYFKEMNNCDQTCNSLRDEIRRLEDFTTTMCIEARCAFTDKLVVKASEPFYVFPSGFVALEGSLKREIMPYLTKEQKIKVISLEKDIQELKNKENVTGEIEPILFEKTEIDYKLDVLQSEMDGLIAAECPLTGSIMIESIDHCFGDSKEDETYMASDDIILEA